MAHRRTGGHAAAPPRRPCPRRLPRPPSAVSFYAAVVVRYDDTRESVTAGAAGLGLQDGKVLIPCEFNSVGLPDIYV